MKGRDLQQYGSLQVVCEEGNGYHSSCVVVLFLEKRPFLASGGERCTGAGDGHYGRLQVE